MVRILADQKNYLVKFEYRCNKDILLIQLTFMKQESIPKTEEAEKVEIPEKPVENVDIYKGLYQKVYLILQFKN